MELGKVQPAEDGDFQSFMAHLNESEGWSTAFRKNHTTVSTKIPPTEGCVNNRIIKLKTTFQDVGADVAYDVLQDVAYRKQWDKHVIKYQEIGHVDENNNVCYYAVSCPKPLKNRDFVIQSSWRQTNDRSGEYFIINHSVCHRDYPPTKGFVRAVTHLAGYWVKALSGGEGCQLGYVAHINFKGTTPSWLINMASKTIAPSAVKRLHKACQNYQEWKKKNSPDRKPWLHPEQITSPRLALEYDCQQLDEDLLAQDGSFEEEEDLMEQIAMESKDVPLDASDGDEDLL